MAARKRRTSTRRTTKKKDNKKNDCNKEKEKVDFELKKYLNFLD